MVLNVTLRHIGLRSTCKNIYHRSFYILNTHRYTHILYYLLHTHFFLQPAHTTILYFTHTNVCTQTILHLMYTISTKQEDDQLQTNLRGNNVWLRQTLLLERGLGYRTPSRCQPASCRLCLGCWNSPVEKSISFSITFKVINVMENNVCAHEKF